MSVSGLVAKNTLNQFLGKFVTMAVSIVVTALVTRIYGISGYGVFNIIVSFPALFYIIVDFGYNAIGTRELSKDDSKIGTVLGNILILRTSIFIFLLAFIFLVLALLPYSTFIKTGIMLSSLTIFTTTMFSTANIGFQVKLRYDFSRLALSLGSLFLLVWVVFFSMLKSNLIVLSFGYVLGGFISAVSAFYLLKLLKIIPKIKFDAKLCKYLTYSSFSIGLMFIFSQINFKMDSILLSFLHLPVASKLTNVEAVGIYGIAYKIFEVSLIVPTFFMNSVYPLMIKKNLESFENLMSVFKKSFLFLLTTGFLVSIAGFFLSDFFIKLIAGNGFGLSTSVLKILFSGLFIFYITQPMSWFIVTLGKEKLLPYVYFLAATLNIVLNVLFIPKFSFFASAYITWISELFIALILSVICIKVYREKSQSV